MVLKAISGRILSIAEYFLYVFKHVKEIFTVCLFLILIEHEGFLFELFYIKFNFKIKFRKMYVYLLILHVKSI